MKNEIKVFTFEVTELKETKRDGKNYANFKGFASTYGNVDRGGDAVCKGAFDESIKSYCMNRRPIKMLYQHDAKDIIGVFDPNQMVDNEKGLIVEGEINLDVQKGKEAYALMKQGALTDMSIGYTVDDHDFKDDVRLLKKLTLWEISLVGEPMNAEAQIMSVKAVGAVTTLPLASHERAWSANAAINRIRKFTDSVDEPSAGYKRAFMYYDPERANDFTAYKLPYVDIVDGKMMAVPRAIFAIAAVLNGARGGVNIPETDKAKIKKIVNHYYDKMDIDSPLAKDFRTSNLQLTIDDVYTIKTKREYEHVLRDSGLFSKEAALFLSSLFYPEKRSDSVSSKAKEVNEEHLNYIRRLRRALNQD